MDARVLQFGVALFWIASAALFMVVAALVGFLTMAWRGADRRRRSLFRQELIWTLAPALLVAGLAVASDLFSPPSISHPVPIVRAR